MSAVPWNRLKAMCCVTFVDAEDEKKVAVVDLRTMKVLTKYMILVKRLVKLYGLGLDIKNHILFAMWGRV